MISVFNGRSRSLGRDGGDEVHVQVSVALRKHLHLFKGAKLGLFMAIALHSDRHGWSRPSTRTLRKETGLNPDTIFKALGELCDLKVEGHRVLLRKGARRSLGQFSSNNYLIFPTKEEIEKYETPYLFPSSVEEDEEEPSTISGGTVSEKPDTVKTGVGENPCRENTVSEKTRVGKIRHRSRSSNTELDPQEESSYEDSSSKKLETHTHKEESAMKNDSVCVGSKFTEEAIRQYAWASYNFDQAFNEWKRNHGRKDFIEGIRNPEGWAKAAFRTGEFDHLVQEFVQNPRMFEFKSPEVY